MFKWLNKKPLSENQMLGAKMIETLKLFRREHQSVIHLFVSQTAVLNANFMGRYENIERFCKQPDDEKGRYFSKLLVIENPTLEPVPAIKLSYAFYHCLIWLEEAGLKTTVGKLRTEYRLLRNLSLDRT